MDGDALHGLGVVVEGEVPGLLQPAGMVGVAAEEVLGLLQPVGRAGSMPPWVQLERFGWVLLGPGGNEGWSLKNEH